LPHEREKAEYKVKYSLPRYFPSFQNTGLQEQFAQLASR
jgi:hypothetical protein